MSTRLFAPRTSPEIPASAPKQNVERPSGRHREAAALLLFTGAVFLFLALASAKVDPSDPTVGQRNWVGPTGVFLAGILIQGFGVVAWLAPLELSLIAAPLFRGRSKGDLGLRLAGDLTLAVVFAALCQVALPGSEVFGKAAIGGNVGLLFGELMREFFSTAGSFLVGLAIAGLILIGRSSFSFISFCHRALALLRLISERLRAVSLRVSSAWRQAWQLRRAERARLATEAAPRIETADPDAAIMMHLAEDDESDWIPLERTGTPPLAVSEALRKRDGADMTALFAGLDAASEASSPAAEKAPPAAETPAAPKTKSRRSSDKKREKTPPPPEDVEDEGNADDAEDIDGDEDAEDDDDASEAIAEANASPSPSLPVERPARVRGKQDPKGPRIVDTKPEQKIERAAPPVGTKVRPKRGEFTAPTPDLLDPPPVATADIDRDAILEQATRLEKTLADYGVAAKVEEIHPGPTVTTYEVACEAGTKVSKVASLADDLALGLSRKVRIIAPIPGKSRIGFELPNDERQPVSLRELIEDQRFEKLSERAPLPVVLGRDIVGAPFYADLASMPHVIVAGATGAGKSVGLNVMLSSLLFKRAPEELRFLMIDPKVVELAPFDGIPHMLLPVVTDMKQAATALRWAVEEMERRYQLFADAGTKNIITYNAWVKRVLAGEIPPPAPETVEVMTADGALLTVPAAKDGSDGVPLPGKLPYIVIVVDEFADLMMQQGKEVESCVARLAQKARAAGMHVVLATQRPSVDVITGMIKANFPSRIGFRVAQKVDSRTILDEQGAELLLGRGDMLVKLNGSTDTRRVQCPFVSEEEVSRLTDYLRTQGSPEYHEAILQASDDDGAAEEEEEAQDSRFEEAVMIVRDTQRCSTSWLQRKMTIGYNRAAKIVEMMERRGYVGPPNGSRDREVLLPPG
jgi:S-DNA-T family DNA segregation ATPase FtsK/SpoIIIE